MYTSPGKKGVVLLIEADASLRRLIALGLQHRGMQVIEARSPQHVPSLAIQHVDLLVLDIDDGIDSNWSFLDGAQSHPLFSSLPMVVLAWERCSNAQQPVTTTTHTQLSYLTKPFDARVLHDTVEQLLTAHAADKARAEAQVEELLLARYSSSATPSVWPMITAIGVLLAIIGMLLQVAVAAAGILLVIVALLLWTLGGSSRPEMANVPIGA